ncbi:hypothetical protein GEMRC1_000249 [Eukaryota sp. GEM-RC1]
MADKQYPDALSGLPDQPGMYMNSVDPDAVLCPFDLLEKFMYDVFVAAGVPPEEAKISTEVLIEADKTGIDSHGIGRLKIIYINRLRNGTQEPVTNFEVVRETDTTAVIDGHNGNGHVIAQRSCDMAIEKAKKHGLGMTVCRNSTHFGIAGYYARRAAQQGIILMTGTNARPSIAPTGGVQNMIGTNPLTFGIPTDEEFPFVLDCATSIAHRGKIEMYNRLGKELPPGWVIGSDGTARVDTANVLKDFGTGNAALTPLGGLGEIGGGHKGYGYALVVEILSSCLQSGNFMNALLGTKDGKPCPIELGHFFLAINPECFRDLEDFKKQVGDLLREVRASRKAPGVHAIYTPGEKEFIAKKRREELGGTLVPPALQKEACELRDLYNLDYTFPWEK